MILFENSIAKLEYDPKTGICVAGYPDLHEYLIPEIKQTISLVIHELKGKGVKKLLLDSSNTVISVPEERSRYISTYLATALALIGLQKLARLQSVNQEVEETAERNIEHIQASQQLPFQLRNFDNKESALEWLRS